MNWKPLKEAKPGGPVLIKSPDLIHPDFNPDGVAEGVLYEEELGDSIGREYGWFAVCALWQDSQDCYGTLHTHNITGWMPMPGINT